LRTFLDANSIRYLPVLFEDLIVTPEQEVARIGRFLGTPVTMEHLQSTYDGVLYRKPKTLRDTVEAGLIYFKNYHERLR
jgi:Sulfotransferase domain